MTKFHAVMLDETRCEFGVDIEANSRDEAYDLLAEDYPESTCVQLESPADTKRREQQLMYDIDHGIERDEDGRIVHIEPGYDEPEDDDFDEDWDDEED